MAGVILYRIFFWEVKGGNCPPLPPYLRPCYISFERLSVCFVCASMFQIFYYYYLLLLFFTSTNCIVHGTWTVILKVNSNQKMIFYCFLFSVFSKINSIQMHIELNWDLKKLTQSIRLYWVYTPIDLYTRKFTQLCTQYGQLRYVTKSKFSFG